MVKRTRWRVLVAEPVALVMVKAPAAARGKVLVRKVEAMVEAMKLRMVVAVSS